jgi:hypothetical protein
VTVVLRKCLTLSLIGIGIGLRKVPVAYRGAAAESGFLKKEARLAGTEAALCLHIHDPDLGSDGS